MTALPLPPVTRHFVDTPDACIHIAASGSGPAVLMLHQTPRSWDEFRRALPMIGRSYRAIAMDTVGFGDSTALPFPDNSIERWAACAFGLLDALDLPRAALVGHHTGAAVAVEMAAQRPERIAAMVLSAPPYVDAARRRAKAGKPVVDEVSRRADGGHLSDLWSMRRPDYPPGDIELLERFMIDALKAGPMAAEGHRVVNRYRMEERLALVRCPARILAPLKDRHAAPHARQVARAIAGADVEEMDDAMVPFPDQQPEIFADAVLRFLHRAYPRLGAP